MTSMPNQSNSTKSAGTLPLNRFEQLRFAQAILTTEGQAVLRLADTLPGSFCDAVELIYQCTGSVIVTGMGKAGLVGQKLVATLASTGTPSHFLHPGEAFHGDLGRIGPHDVVLALSNSGATEEIVRLLPVLADMQTKLIAMTSKPSSPLAQAAEVLLDLGPLAEACPLGLAPSTSTTVMIALGDALALTTSRLYEFGPQDFARYHPGGSLGRKLAKVQEVMRPLAQCRVAPETHTIREVMIQAGRPGRRTGAVMLVDETGKLTGIFTDSDLARLFEQGRDSALDQPIAQCMTAHPATAASGLRLSEALEVLTSRKISELPVIDEQGHPLGLLDITDLVGEPTAEEKPAEQKPQRKSA
jgi:arabinose-5-phosphate isomerase